MNSEPKILKDPTPLPGNHWYAPQYQLPSFDIPTFISLTIKTILFYSHLLLVCIGIHSMMWIEYIEPLESLVTYLRPKFEQMFGILMVTCFQFFNPSSLVIYRGEGVAPEEVDILTELPPKSDIELNMNRRAVVICNHQGCQFFKFLFLNRKWEEDKVNMLSQLSELNQTPSQPLWFLLFPEGTTLCEETRLKSKKFGDKIGQKTYHHLLIPRHLGLYHSVKELKHTVDYLYDITIGFPGIPAYTSPQYTYTLHSMYIAGISPKQIHMHIRKFRIQDIPLNTEEAFAEWLLQRWEEKDAILDHFYKTHKFPMIQEANETEPELPKIVSCSLNNLNEILFIWTYSLFMMLSAVYIVKLFFNLF